MDKIAVVILNWNGCDMLRSFLPSVVRFSEVDGAVVYVADNGSTDASVAMLRREFPSVHLILLEENHGFADGYNLALKQVEAEYVVLLNSDVEVTEHWLVPLAEYMDAYPETAACQPKIRSWRNKGQFEYAGAAGGFIDRYGYPFCRGRIMGVVEEDKGQYDTVIPIFWATGAALFIRLADYREAGGLDGRFFAHIDDGQRRPGVRRRGKACPYRLGCGADLPGGRRTGRAVFSRRRAGTVRRAHAHGQAPHGTTYPQIPQDLIRADRRKEQLHAARNQPRGAFGPATGPVPLRRPDAGQQAYL